MRRRRVVRGGAEIAAERAVLAFQRLRGMKLCVGCGCCSAQETCQFGRKALIRSDVLFGLNLFGRTSLRALSR